MRAVSLNSDHTKCYEHALIVSSSKKTISSIKKKLGKSGTTLLFANTEEQALDCLTNAEVSYILVDASLSGIECYDFIRSVKVNNAEQPIPIILLASQHENLQLSSLLSSGCDEILFEPFTPLALSARLSSIKKLRELDHLYKCSVNEQLLAKNILTNAIDEISTKIDEIRVLSLSKDIFSGDIFMTARHPDGSLNILLADFTGHGLSAAICALPVANIFSVMTEKGFDVDYIVESINKKLYTLLPTNMFMACSFINLSKNLKHIKIWNGGMPDIYIKSNLTGEIRHKVSSANLPLGITETHSNQFNPITLDIMPGDQLILFTDGLTEALNLYNEMFGEHRVEQCLQDHNDEKTIFMSVVNSFSRFCGDISPVDDVTLASIPCTIDLMDLKRSVASSSLESAGNCCDIWCLELEGASLRDINPVPIVIGEIYKKYGPMDSANELSKILSLLYENLIEECCSVDGTDSVGTYVSNKCTIDFSSNYIKISIKEINHNRMPALLVQVIDSGKSVSDVRCIDALSRCNINLPSVSNKKQSLIYELNTLSNKDRVGNSLEAIISFQSCW